MSGEVQLAITSARVLFDMVSGAKSAIDQHKLALAMQDLNQRLLAAQEAALRLNDLNATQLKRIRELEEQASSANDWKAEAEKYKLTEIASGVFAMATKRFMHDPEGSVKLCQQCFKSKKDSVLQAEPDPERLVRLHCHECGLTLRFTKYL